MAFVSFVSSEEVTKKKWCNLMDEYWKQKMAERDQRSGSVAESQTK